jgi:hypothetical protein
MLLYDGVDPAGGVQYSRYDRVRVESVFKDTVNKEKRIRDKFPTSKTFQMNLVNGNMKGSLLKLKHSHNPNMIITEKVEKRSPLERNTTPPGPRTGAEEYGNTMIRHTEKPPWQKVDLPQSRAQEIGWLVAASMQSQQLNAQRSHSMRTNPVGNARVEAYRSASLSDMSRGKAGADATLSPSGKDASGKNVSKSRSQPQLPRLIPHIPNEGIRAEAAMLNNRRYHHPKNTCALTEYADAYYAVMRCSPFNQGAARG